MTTDITKHLPDAVGVVFDQMGWAEDEITKAQARHPDKAEQLWEQFLLLRATDDLMRTEFVYRAHCAELLDRVAGGYDCRPATTVEMALGCSRLSLEAPLTPTVAALYERLFAQAFPDKADGIGVTATADAQVVALEHELRDKARQDWRTAQ